MRFPVILRVSFMWVALMNRKFFIFIDQCVESNDQQSIIQVLVYKYNQFSVHQRNLQTLMTETDKIINQITTPPYQLFLFCENTHNICSYQFNSNNIRITGTYSLETLVDRSPLSCGKIYPKNTNYKNL